MSKEWQQDRDKSTSYNTLKAVLGAPERAALTEKGSKQRKLPVEKQTIEEENSIYWNQMLIFISFYMYYCKYLVDS